MSLWTKGMSGFLLELLAGASFDRDLVRAARRMRFVGSSSCVLTSELLCSRYPLFLWVAHGSFFKVDIVGE